MNEYAIKDFGKIIKKNAQEMRHNMLPSGTDVFRIYDRNQEDFPITIDLYANYARVQVYSDDELENDVIDVIRDQINRMVYIDSDKIIITYRAKREKGQQHEKTDTEPVIVNVRENGLVFKTNLTTYADTGLFLDHVNTRLMISSICAGMNVLNLFSYTGSFSVYAASGRAASVTSVDISATYTKWAEENLKANGYEGDNYKCICRDASKFIDEAIEKPVRYDIIVFDPPAFSNSHKMESDFDVQRDFYDWIKKLKSVLTKNGMIMFSTNLGSFKIDRRRLRGLSVKETTQQLWADGFVKGRKGTVRSWVMALDDSSLSLDWSEDKKSEEKIEEKKEYKTRRQYSGERHGSDRGSSYNRNRGERREDGRREYGRRDGGSHGRDRREDRRDDRRRSYSDSRRSEDYESKHRYTGRRDEDDRRNERRYEGFSDRRTSRREEYNREDKPGFDRSSKYGRSERFSHERRSESYGERRDNRRSSKSGDRFEREDRTQKPKQQKKPYGYDSFKPARSRNDSSDFFWNED